MKIQIGDVGYRRPDGSVYRWEPILREVTEPQAQAALDDAAQKAARIFAAKIAAYKNAAAVGEADRQKKTAP